MNNKKIVGIKNKDSGIVSSLQVVEDVSSFINEVRAAVGGKPCAYSMFPDKYQFAVFSIGEEEQIIEFKDGHHD